MPNQTPTYKWPWPLGTDRVMDGDNAMGSLAQAIEATVKLLPINPGVMSPSSSFAAPTGTPTAIPGMSYTVSPSQSELWVMAAVLDWNWSGADPGAMVGQLAVDGAIVRTGNLGILLAGGTRAPMFLLHAQTYAAGSHTVEARAGKSASSGVCNVTTPSLLLVLRFPR